MAYGAAKPGQEHYLTSEHAAFRDGDVSGGRGHHQVEGTTTAAVFETYVERVLCPGCSSLEPGQVVLMDNLDAHRPKRVRELIEERGCELLYLPACTREGFVEAMGKALSAVSPEDAPGFFEYAGYRQSVG